MAAYILGHTRDIRRFPTAEHYARYNATAPISASTSANDRHRLNPYVNRQLNHAMHIAAVTQAGHDTPMPDLLPTQDHRRQQPQRSAPRAQTTDLQRRLPSAPR